jgi:hypothetical protein
MRTVPFSFKSEEFSCKIKKDKHLRGVYSGTPRKEACYLTPRLPKNAVSG